VAALRATHRRLAKLFYKLVEIVVTGTDLPEELDQFGIGGLIANRLRGSIRHGSEFTRAAEPAGSRERTQEFEIGRAVYRRPFAFIHLHIRRAWQAECILIPRNPSRPTSRPVNEASGRGPEMKSITNRLFLFAAAALSLGTVAYGQDILKADIPFAFHGPAGTESAGHYTVRVQNHGGGYIAQIRDRATGRGVISLTNQLGNKNGAAITPHLVFRCRETGCQLSEIWTPTGGFSVPVKHVRDAEYVASIPLTVAGD
jgi:hypothetical protein